MQKHKKIKRLLRALEFVVLAFAVLFFAYIFICTKQGKAVDVFGVNVLHITTGSMEPTIEEGEYILVTDNNMDSLNVKDIVAYYTEDPEVYGQLVVHRIVKVNDDGTYLTKGDANMKTDELSVRKEQIIGRYSSSIWFLNWLVSFTDIKKLMLVLVVIPLLLVSIYEFSTVTRLVYGLKSEEYLEELKKKGIESAEEKKERLKKKAIEEYLKKQKEKAEDAYGEEQG